MSVEVHEHGWDAGVTGPSVQQRYRGELVLVSVLCALCFGLALCLDGVVVAALAMFAGALLSAVWASNWGVEEHQLRMYKDELAVDGPSTARIALSRLVDANLDGEHLLLHARGLSRPLAIPVRPADRGLARWIAADLVQRAGRDPEVIAERAAERDVMDSASVFQRTLGARSRS